MDMAWIDHQLNRADLTLEQLNAMKDRLLRHQGENPRATFEAGVRISRINLRVKTLAEDRWPSYFVGAARRLLDAETFAVLCREAHSIQNERLQAATSAPPNAPPPETIPSKPALAASLAEVATTRAIKFDPARLFKEFGREKVLTMWAGLLPEDRPETAAAFRNLLLGRAS